MALPKLQRKALELVPEIADLLKDGNEKEIKEENKKNIFHFIESRLIKDGTEEEIFFGILLKSFVLREMEISPLIKRGGDKKTTLDNNIKAFIRGNFAVSFEVNEQAHIWNESNNKEGCLYNFIPWSADGYYVYLVIKDVLESKFGETGRRMANSVAVLMNANGRTSDMKEFENQITEDGKLNTKIINIISELKTGKQAQEFLVQQAEEHNVNLLSDIDILEIGGGRTIELLPIIKLFGLYEKYHAITKETNDAHADVIDEDFLTLSNYEKYIKKDYNYVVSANVLTYNAIKGESNKEKILRYNGELFCVCSNVLKKDGKMIHINSYDQGRTPALADSKLHQISGVKPVATRKYTEYSNEKIHIFEKNNEIKVEKDDFNMFYRENNRKNIWQVIKPFKFDNKEHLYNTLKKVDWHDHHNIQDSLSRGK